MSGKIFVWLLTTVLLTTAPAAEAQQTKKVARIGVLSQSNVRFMSTQLEAFRQGLRAFGYVEGQNIAIEYRYAEGKLDRLPDLRRSSCSAQSRRYRRYVYTCGFGCEEYDQRDSNCLPYTRRSSSKRGRRQSSAARG